MPKADRDAMANRLVHATLVKLADEIGIPVAGEVVFPGVVVLLVADDDSYTVASYNNERDAGNLLRKAADGCGRGWGTGLQNNPVTTDATRRLADLTAEEAKSLFASLVKVVEDVGMRELGIKLAINVVVGDGEIVTIGSNVGGKTVL